MLNRWNFLKTGFYEGINIGQIGHTTDQKPTYAVGEARFTWDPIPEVATYRVTIARYQEEPFRSLGTAWDGDTFDTTVHPGLPASGDGEFYLLSLNGYNTEGDLVASLMVSYTNGFGGDYRFRIGAQLTPTATPVRATPTLVTTRPPGQLQSSGILTLENANRYLFSSAALVDTGQEDLYFETVAYQQEDGGALLVSSFLGRVASRTRGTSDRSPWTRVPVPATEPSAKGRPAQVNHVYVVNARDGQPGRYIVLRVTRLDEGSVTFDWVYYSPTPVSATPIPGPATAVPVTPTPTPGPATAVPVTPTATSAPKTPTPTPAPVAKAVEAGAASGPAFTVGKRLQAGGIDIELEGGIQGGYSSPFVVDWDNEGKKDLLVGDAEGHINLFLNSGTDSDPTLTAGVKIHANGAEIQVSHYGWDGGVFIRC